MKVALNSARVPEPLRPNAEEYVRSRLLSEPEIVWREENHEMVLLSMTSGQMGSSQDLDSHGRPIGEPEDATGFIMMGMETDLRQMLRDNGHR